MAITAIRSFDVPKRPYHRTHHNHEEHLHPTQKKAGESPLPPHTSVQPGLLVVATEAELGTSHGVTQERLECRVVYSVAATALERAVGGCTVCGHAGISGSLEEREGLTHGVTLGIQSSLARTHGRAGTDVQVALGVSGADREVDRVGFTQVAGQVGSAGDCGSPVHAGSCGVYVANYTSTVGSTSIVYCIHRGNTVVTAHAEQRSTIGGEAGLEGDVGHVDTGVEGEEVTGRVVTVPEGEGEVRVVRCVAVYADLGAGAVVSNVTMGGAGEVVLAANDGGTHCSGSSCDDAGYCEEGYNFFHTRSPFCVLPGDQASQIS